jgi:transaldolase
MNLAEKLAEGIRKFAADIVTLEKKFRPEITRLANGCK